MAAASAQQDEKKPNVSTLISRFDQFSSERANKLASGRNDDLEKGSAEDEEQQNPVSGLPGRAELRAKQGREVTAKDTKKLPDLRLLLVGRTGHGKSATANSIMGKTLCKVSSSSKSVTEKCDWQVVERNGRKIEVVDTPGFCDTELSQDAIKRELYRALLLSSPGFNAVAFVMKPERFTREMKELVELFFNFFGKEAEKFAFIIFTHTRTKNELKSFLDLHDDDKNPDFDYGDGNESDWVIGEDVKQAIDKNGDNMDKTLKEFIERCGKNIVILDNKAQNTTKKDVQVQAILNQVEKIKRATNNKHFSNVNFRVVGMYLSLEKKLESCGNKALHWVPDVVKRILNPEKDESDENEINDAISVEDSISDDIEQTDSDESEHLQLESKESLVQNEEEANCCKKQDIKVQSKGKWKAMKTMVSKTLGKGLKESKEQTSQHGKDLKATFESDKKEHVKTVNQDFKSSVKTDDSFVYKIISFIDKVKHGFQKGGTSGIKAIGSEFLNIFRDKNEHRLAIRQNSE